MTKTRTRRMNLLKNPMNISYHFEPFGLSSYIVFLQTFKQNWRESYKTSWLPPRVNSFKVRTTVAVWADQSKRQVCAHSLHILWMHSISIHCEYYNVHCKWQTWYTVNMLDPFGSTETERNLLIGDKIEFPVAWPPWLKMGNRNHHWIQAMLWNLNNAIQV